MEVLISCIFGWWTTLFLILAFWTYRTGRARLTFLFMPFPAPRNGGSNQWQYSDWPVSYFIVSNIQRSQWYKIFPGPSHLYTRDCGMDSLKHHKSGNISDGRHTKVSTFSPWHFQFKGFWGRRNRQTTFLLITGELLLVGGNNTRLSRSMVRMRIRNVCMSLSVERHSKEIVKAEQVKMK